MTRTIENRSGNVLANVGPSGSAELSWLVDHDGAFFSFRSLGLEPMTILQWLRLSRRRERYQMEEPRRITIGELLELVKPLKDEYPEAPVARVVRSRLKKFDPMRTVDREIMADLMGEEGARSGEST